MGRLASNLEFAKLQNPKRPVRRAFFFWAAFLDSMAEVVSRRFNHGCRAREEFFRASSAEGIEFTACSLLLVCVRLESRRTDERKRLHCIWTSKHECKIRE
jgi:hypothetical protein